MQVAARSVLLEMSSACLFFIVDLCFVDLLSYVIAASLWSYQCRRIVQARMHVLRNVIWRSLCVTTVISFFLYIQTPEQPHERLILDIAGVRNVVPRICGLVMAISMSHAENNRYNQRCIMYDCLVLDKQYLLIRNARHEYYLFAV